MEPQVSLDDVQGSMNVYGLDGEKIGKVGEIATETAFIPVETVTEGNTAIPEQTRYLRAERLGHDLWIPESAIRDITMAGGVVVDCTKDECIQRYSTKPNVV